MSFTKKVMISGEIAEAQKMNVNFGEIYEELDGFPGLHGAFADDAFGTAQIPNGSVVWSNIDEDAYLTSNDSLSSASDLLLATSKAIKTYWESFL